MNTYKLDAIDRDFHIAVYSAVPFMCGNLHKGGLRQRPKV